MPKKKKDSSLEVITFYMDYVVAHGEKPSSVEVLAEEKGFEVALFYDYFSSFKDIDQEVFKRLFEDALNVLLQSESFSGFSQKDKLIAVYFTFFENLSLNRDFVKLVLDGFENQLKALSTLSLLKQRFIAFIDSLQLDTLNLNIEQLEKIQKKTIQESAWIQCLFILKFWLGDTSESFEKTDVFIEKSLNTTFDLLHTKSLHNIIDLGKFLYKEKVQSN